MTQRWPVPAPGAQGVTAARKPEQHPLHAKGTALSGGRCSRGTMDVPLLAVLHAAHAEAASAVLSGALPRATVRTRAATMQPA